MPIQPKGIIIHSMAEYLKMAEDQEEDDGDDTLDYFSKLAEED